MQLLAHQYATVRKLMLQPNVLCADEAGTGKTFVGIALDQIRRHNHEGQTLIVAPMSVVPVWADHLSQHTDLKVRHVTDYKRLLEVEAECYLIHFDVLWRMPELQKRQWLHVIYDEVHRIQNRKAVTTKTAKKLKAQYKTGLSGTPVTSTPDRLFSILQLLYPKKYTSYWRYFYQHVASFIDDDGFLHITGPKNEAALLAEIGPFYSRTLKKDCLDLPEKYYSTVPVQLLPVQRTAYDTMRKESLVWLNDAPLAAPTALAALTRLQQFAVAYAAIENGAVRLAEPSAKLDALMELLVDEPVPTVVFSQFAQAVALISARLTAAGITHVTLTGSVPQADRGGLVERFQRGDTQVFVGTIGAGGVGITLTAASRVIFVDRSWSPAENEQAEDRLHRIGQRNAVQVIDLVADRTVDAAKGRRLELKKEWLRRLLGD